MGQQPRWTCPGCLGVFRTAFARCPVDGTELEPFDEDPLLGATFADRYVIESCVGEGAMGRVYRARHVRVSRRFAVKVLFGDHAGDRKMQARFAHEAEAASRLDHPNVVPVLDFGEAAGGLLYLVMDFVDGPSLSTVIERSGPLAPARVRHLLRHLASGLAHAHDRNLVHRDFKSDNVLVTGTGDDEIPRIADFGIAVLLEGGNSSRLTTDGLVMGTPAYMAPEQATQESIDCRTDLFSLGVCVYEMLAGTLPFDGPAIEVARRNLNDDPPPIGERAPEAPGDAELERIAMVLMAKNPAERFQSAREVLDALGARREQTRPGATGPVRGRRRRLVFAGAGAAVVTAAIAGSLVAAERGRNPAAAESHAAGAPPDAGTEATASAAPDADRAAAPAAERTDSAATAERPDARKAGTGARSPRRRGARRGGRRGREAVTSEALTARYRAVGAALQELGDGPKAKRLHEAYLSLPFAAALRHPARRDEVDRALRRIQSELRRR